jgi:hypothetical protein
MRWRGAYLVSTCVVCYCREALGVWVDVTVVKVLGQSVVMWQRWNTAVITFIMYRASSGSRGWGRVLARCRC